MVDRHRLVEPVWKARVIVEAGPIISSLQAALRSSISRCLQRRRAILLRHRVLIIARDLPVEVHVARTWYRWLARRAVVDIAPLRHTLPLAPEALVLGAEVARPCHRLELVLTAVDPSAEILLHGQEGLVLR